MKRREKGNKAEGVFFYEVNEDLEEVLENFIKFFSTQIDLNEIMLIKKKTYKEYKEKQKNVDACN